MPGREAETGRWLRTHWPVGLAEMPSSKFRKRGPASVTRWRVTKEDTRHQPLAFACPGMGEGRQAGMHSYTHARAHTAAAAAAAAKDGGIESSTHQRGSRKSSTRVKELRIKRYTGC